MIDITILTEKDKGRRVAYKDGHNSPEEGTITGWNAHYVFVHYDRNRLHHRGTATPQERLTFLDDSPNRKT